MEKEDRSVWDVAILDAGIKATGRSMTSMATINVANWYVLNERKVQIRHSYGEPVIFYHTGFSIITQDTALR